MSARRIIIGALTAVILGAGMLFSTSSTAHGLDLCKDAPIPVGPKSGMAGLITPKPLEVSNADPFADPRVPIGDVYGYSWGWTLYDLGCTPDALSDPQAVFQTANANLIIGFANTGVAAIGLVERFAKDTGIQWFSEWVAATAGVIRPLVFGGPSEAGMLFGLLPLAAIALGVWLAWKARKADYATVARAAVMAFVCIALAAWTILFPVVASKTVDDGIRQVASVAGGAFNASLTDGVNRQALYRSWLAGQFGDPDSALAKEYGPRTYAATHYSWAEWGQIENDPTAREQIDKRKSDEYKDIAKEVKEKNPSAYLTFQGRGDRVGPALFGLMSGFVMGIFALVAYFMILLGRAMMQILVIVTPIAAIVGMLPPGYGALMRIWDLFAAAIWSVAKFTFAAGLMATILGLLATMDPVSALLWMTVVTVIAFYVLKPAREFKRLMPGLDPNRHYTREAFSKLASTLTTAIAGAASGGAAAAVVTASNTAGKQEDTPSQAPTQGSAPATQRVDIQQMQRPPLPAPTFTQVGPATKPLELEAAPAARQWVGVLDAPQEERSPLALTAGPEKATPAGQAALPAGQTTVEINPDPGTGTTQLPPPPARHVIDGTPGSTHIIERPTGGTTVIEHRHGITATTPAISSPSEIVDAEIIDGPAVTDTTIYRRPNPVDIVDAEIVDGPPLNIDRDRGTDQPGNELMLYRSDDRTLTDANTR